ncbi:MAG: S-layer homology domain-containing protein [Clostridiales bacterium]|nr:MAG: S-layer homology domain-containing protein [Clostridiales bacterium]
MKENITQGTSATTFSPNDTCTRAQIFDVPLARGRLAQG